MAEHEGNWKCLECGRSDVPHQAHGLCRNCYMRKYRGWQKKRKAAVWQGGYDAGFSDGQEEGREKAASALSRLLEDHDASCWYEGGKVFIKAGGKTRGVEV